MIEVDAYVEYERKQSGTFLRAECHKRRAQFCNKRIKSKNRIHVYNGEFSFIVMFFSSSVLFYICFTSILAFTTTRYGKRCLSLFTHIAVV